MIFVHHCRLIQQCVEDVSVYKFSDRHFDFVLSGHALLDFCNLSCCATARAAGLKTQVHGCVRFYSPFNDVSLEKLRDSQRKMLQQIENTRLYGKNFEIQTLCNVILF